jgi:hypothetical protein
MAFTTRRMTRLKAWDQYNTILKKYSKQPIIKKVDIEELKKQFTVSEAAPKTSKKKAAEAAAE